MGRASFRHAALRSSGAQTKAEAEAARAEEERRIAAEAEEQRKVKAEAEAARAEEATPDVDNAAGSELPTLLPAEEAGSDDQREHGDGGSVASKAGSRKRK